MKRRWVTFVGVCCLIVGLVAPSATAIPDEGKKRLRGLSSAERDQALQVQEDSVIDMQNEALDAQDEQHGSPDGHLPGQRRNVKRISRLRLTDLQGGIADVAYFRGHAYLNKWHPHCGEAGTEVVDITKPARPRKVAFLPAGANDYTTEGAHAFRMNTRAFRGDVYVVSHESCDAEGKGGISLWDVSDPSDPWPLVRHFGDRTFGGDAWAHDSHSAMGWSAGRRAYVVAVDNLGLTESAFGVGGDVDIFDVTDPSRPVQIADFSLVFPPGMLDEAQDNLANGANANHHDMWLKRMDNDRDGDKEWTLMLSYWDAGWIKMDVSNPANPVYLDDSDYPATDAETTRLPGGPFTPEGNAHQGEWSRNGRWFLGTDEDFAPFRAQFQTDDGDTYDGSEFSWTPPVSEEYEDGQVNGPTVFGGLACGDIDPDVPNENPETDSIPNAADYDAGEGEEKILVVSRGGCFFSVKVDNAQRNGWDAVIVGQSHAGTLSGQNPDSFICGSQGHDFTPTIVALCTGHRAIHGFFDDDPAYTGPDGADLVVGAQGDDVTARADIFDGWGYLQLLNARTLRHRDTFAPPKVHDRDCASGCGTMSVHEIATDKRKGKNLGYLSWYGLGLRVVKFGRDGIKPKGVYMDVAGNDFWGVEVIKRGKRRPLIAMSDRDSGLWIFKYTGRE